jgi:predicted dienelactone hydrolase
MNSDSTLNKGNFKPGICGWERELKSIGILQNADTETKSSPRPEGDKVSVHSSWFMVHGFQAAHKPTGAALFPTPINHEQSTMNDGFHPHQQGAEGLPLPLVEKTEKSSLYSSQRLPGRLPLYAFLRSRQSLNLEHRTSALASRISKFSLRKLPASIGIALLNLGLLTTPMMISEPVQGAERIYVSYGPLEFSLPVESLELYAKQGKIDRELGAYTKYLDSKQLEQLRQVLVSRVDVTPLAIAQFLYSAQGETILERMSQIITTKAGQPGFYAIRAALIKAAAAPDGLTLLNVLREFPTYGIRIDTGRGFRVVNQLSNLIRQTQMAIAAVQQQANVEASEQIAQAQAPSGVSSLLKTSIFPPMPDLRQQGPVKYSTQSLTLNDIRRNRTFPADLYLPTQATGKPAPLIVISHGLGSDRETFAYLATHLASYGFAVAVPEHPGSNAQQIVALMNGLASEVTPPSELIDRPLDIKFLLDELGRLYGGRLNLQQVGVLGQSFGGYTALALAGAKLNFEQLRKDCGPSNDSLNVSLLLQCRALVLPPIDYQLSDERVKAAIAINPVNSTIFGQSQLSQIKAPLMLVAASDDTVAPALAEQIQPFTWLNTPNKYLALIENGTHFSTLAPSSGGVPVPDRAIGPSPELAQEYMKALSLAFFETYIANRPEYQLYLRASYAQFISQYPLPLSLVQSLTEEQLRQVSAQPTPVPTLSPSPQR